MAESTLWWLLTGGAIAVELLTGTFYLLMLSLGAACAAIAAHLGASVQVQLVTAAVVGGGAVVFWHLRKGDQQEPSAQANPNVNLDIGESVMVESWNADGTADVHYRGARWTAIHRPGIHPTAGAHRVAEMVGNRLLLDRI